MWSREWNQSKTAHFTFFANDFVNEHLMIYCTCTRMSILWCNNSYCKPVALSNFESLESQKQSQYYEETLYIRAHLEAAKHECFANKESKTRKVTFATVERYLTFIITINALYCGLYEHLTKSRNYGSNSHGANLPEGKKITVTGDNLHEVWKKHKPVLDL